MTQHGDQLREAFESHEHLAPDLGAVYVGSQELFRKYRRRRRGAQVAGGAVLGAGLLAGANNLPASLLPGAVVSVPPVSIATTAPAVVPTSPSQAALAAFFDAGYTSEDAAKLAQLWKMADPSDAKVAAGSKLEAGRPLPFAPAATKARAARDEVARQKFWDAGYDVKDAETLGRLWHVSVSDAKVEAGQKLLTGEKLPIRAAG